MDGIISPSPLSPGAKLKISAPLHHYAVKKGPDNGHHRNPRLWKASVQFEAIFLEQLLASMKKTIPDSGLLKKGFAEDTQSDMFNQAVAESIAQHSRTGIATTLYRQLEKDFPRNASIQAEMNPSDTEIRPSVKGDTDARH